MRTFKLTYHPELDGIRGISILLVLLHHLAPISLLRGGFLGVDVFFVLSGFLITSILFSEWTQQRRISLKRFYIRRALRLLPALALLMLVIGAYALLFMDASHALRIYYSMLVAALYSSNWVLAFNYGYQLGPLAITWSLAIEEQFYLLWPPLLSLALRLKLRKVWILSVLVLSVAAIAVHRWLLWKHGHSITRIYYGTDTRGDALLLGCIAGLLVCWGFWRDTVKVRYTMKLLGIIGVAFVLYQIVLTSHTDGGFFAGRYILFPLAIAELITVVLLWPSRFVLTVLQFSPLVWVGRISYGLYLWHWPIMLLMYPRDGTIPSLARSAAMAGGSFLAASLSFYFLERPFLSRKRAFEPTGSATTPS